MIEEFKKEGINRDSLGEPTRKNFNPKEFKDKLKFKVKKLSVWFKTEQVRLIGKFILGILASLILVFILVLIIFGIGLYKYNWNDPYTNKIIKIIPYPVALVDYEILPYAEFRDDLETLIHYYKKQEELNRGAVKIPPIEEIRTNVLDRMINNKLSEQIARRYRLKVSRSELEEEFNKVINEAGGRANVESILKDLYQWNSDQFKEKVLKPFLLQKKLEEAISFDEDLNQEAKRKAEKILKLVRENKESFESLAKKYSEDPGTAGQGGDLGFFGRGIMVKEFEEVAFTLKPGETSDLIRTIFGYHIIKVEEKRVDKDSKEEQVHARHILIKTKDLNNYLKEEKEKAKIYKFI